MIQNQAEQLIEPLEVFIKSILMNASQVKWAISIQIQKTITLWIVSDIKMTTYAWRLIRYVLIMQQKKAISLVKLISQKTVLILNPILDGIIPRITKVTSMVTPC